MFLICQLHFTNFIKNVSFYSHLVYNVWTTALYIGGARDVRHRKKDKIQERRTRYVAGRACSQARLYIPLYYDGLLTREEYKEKKDAVQYELSLIREPEEVKEITLPDDWEATYRSLDRERKRLFWRRILKHIVLYKNRTAEMVFG